jgi:hypothetical protein
MMLKQTARQILGTKRADEISYRRRLAAYGEAYLKSLGWDRTIVSHQAVNAEGPVPWITYPALRMLERVVRPEFKVFEYGAGNSSLWWAARVAEVVSVEHDTEWAEHVAKRAPKHLTVLSRPMNAEGNRRGSDLAQHFIEDHPDPPLSGNLDQDTRDGLTWPQFAAYVGELAAYPAGHFDVVVVDGMARAMAAWMAAQFVKADGFIVFDNADRWQYNVGYEALAAAGFARIDFYGTRPILVDESCTAIFARSLEWARVNTAIARGRPSDIRW